MKKQSDLSRLMGYAGNYRYFTYTSWVLSAVSALVALVPFVYIWKILRDVLNAAPNYAQAVHIPHYGWMAVLFAVLSYLIYIAALLCSHLSAFRVATNLRLAVSEHLAVLPLGFAETFGSGKLRKIIHESTGAAETYLAHQLPDQYNAIAIPEFLLNLLFYIIITPVISLTLTRMMYMSESKMVVADALARINSVLEAAPMQVQAISQHPQDASVTLQDVHFSYDGKTEVIKGVSLDIQPGQTVAFVGPSGGKSTLANLVCRFFDVQSGSVRVGGADVRDIPKEELMDTISFYITAKSLQFHQRNGNRSRNHHLSS